MRGGAIRWRRLALAVALASGVHVNARAEMIPTVQIRAEIQHVITAQIEAFRRNDGAAALAYATPALRRHFGDGPHFLNMVRTAYPSVFRPSSFTFGALEDGATGTGLTQKVEIVGADGNAVLALYDMQLEPDGAWRIAACALAKSELIGL